MIAALYTNAGFDDVIGLIVFAVFALIVNGIRKAGASKTGVQPSPDSAAPQSSAQDELTKFLQSIAQAQEQAAPPPVPVQAREEYRSVAVRAHKSARGTRMMRSQRTVAPPIPQQADDVPHELITERVSIEPELAPAIAAPVQLTILHPSGVSFDIEEFRNSVSLRKAIMAMEILGKPVALRGPTQ